MNEVFNTALTGQPFTIILLVIIMVGLAVFSRFLILRLLDIISQSTKVIQENSIVIIEMKTLVRETVSHINSITTENQKEILKILQEIKNDIRK